MEQSDRFSTRLTPFFFFILRSFVTRFVVRKASETKGGPQDRNRGILEILTREK